MPSLRALRNRDRPDVATLFTGPAALWLWAELALLHGRGPSARELLG